MISLDNLLLFVPMAAILVMLPGPDFALIAKISLMNGRPQGQAAAVGVALGICVHTTAAMLGISAIIAQSVLWFSVLKYVGAAYLVWLGIQALRAGQCAGQPVSAAQLNLVAAAYSQMGNLGWVAGASWRRYSSSCGIAYPVISKKCDGVHDVIAFVYH